MNNISSGSEEKSVIKKNPEEIIRQHVGFGTIAGAIPIPVVDIASVTAIQIDMIRQLANVYEVDFNEERGKSLVGALVASGLGVTLGRFGASAVKVVPGIGTVLGIGSQVVLSGASTYAIGHVFKQHFDKGGNLFNFNVTEFKEKFVSLFQAGKDVVKEKEKSASRDEVLATLEKLKELKDKKVISNDEFEKAKAELLKKISE